MRQTGAFGINSNASSLKIAKSTRQGFNAQPRAISNLSDENRQPQVDVGRKYMSINLKRNNTKAHSLSSLQPHA